MAVLIFKLPETVPSGMIVPLAETLEVELERARKCKNHILVVPYDWEMRIAEGSVEKVWGSEDEGSIRLEISEPTGEVIKIMREETGVHAHGA
jgi:hypothetical protein